MQIMKPYGIQLQYANSGGYSTENNKQYSNYIKPEFVVKLPEKIRLPSPGPIESVDEVN